MTKIEKIGTYSFLTVAFIILFLSLFFEQTATNLIFTIFVFIAWILFVARSYHLENYLRYIDSKEKLSAIEHIYGLIRNPMRALPLVFVIKPILGVKSMDNLVALINRLTYIIYALLLILIFILIMFNNNIG